MRVRKAAALALGLSLLAASTQAWAAGSASGQLYNITMQTGNMVFYTTGTHTGAPACATSGRFAFNATTTAGQAMLALALTAYGLGKTVNVVGTGACDVWGDSETVSYITSVG